MSMNLTSIDVSFGQKVRKFHFRDSSEGDKGAMRQIFGNEGGNNYNIAEWTQGKALLEYHRRQSGERPSLVVDAGANIGAASVYFLNVLENVFVFAIEPEIGNWRILEINTQDYRNRFNFHGAVSDSDGVLALEDPGYTDLGFRTASVEDGATAGRIIVNSISPRSILADPRTANTSPLIFKIDIEGGEGRLFAGDTSWMSAFPLIIVELHDWMLPFSGSSTNFMKAVARHDFDVLVKGENIYLFNREILAKRPG
jgi:FkbM family methyltransferase